MNPHTLREPHPGHYPWAPLGVPVISYLVTSPDVSHGPPDEGETRDVGLFVERPPVRRPALYLGKALLGQGVNRGEKAAVSG